jgi:hypothetical protein
VCRRCRLGELDCEWPVIAAPTRRADSPMSSTESSERSLQYYYTNVEDGVASPNGWNMQSFPPKGSADYQVAAVGSPHPTLIALLRVPRPPQFPAEARVEDFIKIHHKSVCAGHYFWFSDYNDFCKRDLLELTNKSTPLRFGVAAYSALLFAAHNRDHRARVLALTYYSEALRCVNKTIASYPAVNMTESSPSSDDSVYGILAAVLELTTFEV